MTRFMTCEECGSAEDVSDDEARCPGCGTAYAEATQASAPADRETLQNALIYGQPKRYTQPPAPCPKCYSLEQDMHLLSERIGELEESSKFAWQNARTIDKSRMETEAQLTQLRAELDEWRNGERRYAPLTQDYKEVVAEIRKLRLRREE